jgi:phosphoglucosamine mutase
MLEAAFAAGVCSAGVDVLSVGVLPTAGIAYITRALGALAGVVISASHNPYQDNGIKLFSATGSKLDDALENQIEAQLAVADTAERPTGKAVGRLRRDPEVAQRYIDFLASTLTHEISGRLRIGLDCAHGAASSVAPALFQQLGAHVAVCNAAPDGLNINHQCGALHPEFLQQMVLAEALDVGFAFDGDADRLVAVDHMGAILDGDHILAIEAKDLLDRGALAYHTVVSTVMANLGLDKALHEMGVVLHKTQVGDKYVMQAMHQTGAVLGGEQSGHIIFRQHHTTSDGLLTAVQLINAMLSRNVPLAELIQGLRKFPQVLMNVRLRERCDPLRCPRVQDVVRVAEEVLGGDGRILVRLSGTELVARVMVEGPSQDLIAPLAQRIVQVIADEFGAP